MKKEKKLELLRTSQVVRIRLVKEVKREQRNIIEIKRIISNYWNLPNDEKSRVNNYPRSINTRSENLMSFSRNLSFRRALLRGYQSQLHDLKKKIKEYNRNLDL